MSKKFMTVRDLTRLGPWGKTKWREVIKAGQLRAYLISPRRLVVTAEDYEVYLRQILCLPGHPN